MWRVWRISQRSWKTTLFRFCVGVCSGGGRGTDGICREPSPPPHPRRVITDELISARRWYISRWTDVSVRLCVVLLFIFILFFLFSRLANWRYLYTDKSDTPNDPPKNFRNFSSERSDTVYTVVSLFSVAFYFPSSLPEEYHDEISFKWFFENFHVKLRKKKKRN